MQTHRIEIEKLSTNGDGIARLNGKVTFVPFTLPGECWQVRVLQTKKNYQRALPVEMESASPSRIKPRCPYYTQCGGCQLQHIPYEDQLTYKRDWIIETFARLGHIETACEPVIASPPFEYRNKITLPVLHARGQLSLAYHQAHNPTRLVPVEDCPIAHPLIRESIPQVRSALAQCQPQIKMARRKTPGSRVILRVHDNAVSLRLQNIDLRHVEDSQIREYFARTPIHQIEIDNGKFCKTIQLIQSKALDDPAVQTDSFLQINDIVREKLYSYVDSLPFQDFTHLLDGYCGVGFLTERLARKFNKVTAVELDASSAHDAKKMLSPKFDSITIHNQSIENFLSHAKDQFTAVLLNPPRAGLSPQVRDQILHFHPQDVVMISCHPAALVRDAKIFLENGYKIQSLQPFDMFPQTYHVENVLHLIRTN